MPDSPLYLSKDHHSGLVEYFLHLHQHCLVAASKARLFEVTGAKNGGKKLLYSINILANSKVSVKKT